MSQSIRFIGAALSAWVMVRAISLGMVPGTSALAVDATGAAETAGPQRSTPAASNGPYPLPGYAPSPYAASPYVPSPYAGAPYPAGPYAVAANGAPAYYAPGDAPVPYPGGAYGPPPYAPPYYPFAAGYRPAYPGYPADGAMPRNAGATVIIERPQYRDRARDVEPASYSGRSGRRRATAPYPDTAFAGDRALSPGELAYAEPAQRFGAWPAMRPSSAVPTEPPSFSGGPAPASRFDRLSMSSWAMLRQPVVGKLPPASLSGSGLLGGSQAGARILYRFNPLLAGSLRTTAPVGGSRGGEAALGVRIQPFAGIPVAITAERRQALRHDGGRSAFALFAEGGLYDRRLPLGTRLDAYLQGGVVGAKSRDLFIEGGGTVSRPLWRNLSAGIGVWGGKQPGVARLDAGPRVTVAMRRGVKVHLDYRHKLVGNARPGSGAVLTLAGDF